jgi:hypothetical protein
MAARGVGILYTSDNAREKPLTLSIQTPIPVSAGPAAAKAAEKVSGFFTPMDWSDSSLSAKFL